MLGYEALQGPVLTDDVRDRGVELQVAPPHRFLALCQWALVFVYTLSLEFTDDALPAEYMAARQRLRLLVQVVAAHTPDKTLRALVHVSRIGQVDDDKKL